MKETFRVDIEDRSYPIHIGRNILANAREAILSVGKPIVITDTTVGDLYGSHLADGLGEEVEMLAIPPGESSKTLETAEGLHEILLEMGVDRDSCIVALGGGVVGDLAGFVAATYMRGIPVVQVPTTLLAQADSAIGGKTGVDLPHGKNIIGVFHQPSAVISDVDVLGTLPVRHYLSGMAEVMKYGVIADPELFELLEENAQTILLGDEKVLVDIITKCSKIKASIVEEDEKEHGRRIILNFGHTLGHALEAATSYKEQTHGEAVAIGMAFAARLSFELGVLEEMKYNRIRHLIHALGLPQYLPSHVQPRDLLEAMKTDKKSHDGRIVFVLASDIGEVIIRDDVSPGLLLKTMEAMKQ